MMCEIFLFQALIKLLNTENTEDQQQQQQDKLVYENELWQLAQSDNVIPIDFAIDILSKEDNNHDFLLTFLYTKREFGEMWRYLRL